MADYIYSNGSYIRRCKICTKQISWSVDGSFDACKEHKKRYQIEQYIKEFNSSNKITEDNVLICPYCFEEYEDWWEFGWRDEDCDTIECRNCEKEFNVNVEISTTLTTTKIEKTP